MPPLLIIDGTMEGNLTGDEKTIIKGRTRHGTFIRTAYHARAWRYLQLSRRDETEKYQFA